MEVIPYNQQYHSQLKELLTNFEKEVEFKSNSLDDDDLLEMIEESVDGAIHQIETGNDDCYLVISNNKVLGFQLTHLYNNEADNKIKTGDLEVSQLYVHPEYRKQGIAKMLDRHCLESAQEIDGINRVITFIEEGNPNFALKKSLGFRRSFGYNDGARRYHFFNKSV
jgi:ribosomal protein S18 acetylase RimI-like enzyme